MYQELAHYKRPNSSEIIVSLRQLEDADSSIGSFTGNLSDKVQHLSIDCFLLEVKRKDAGKREFEILAGYEISGRYLDGLLSAIQDRLREFEEEKADTAEVRAYIMEMVEGASDDYVGELSNHERDEFDPLDLGEGIEGLDEKLF